MAKKKVYIGSVGPFVYDDANLINDPDGDFPGEFQRAITSDGSIKPGSADIETLTLREGFTVILIKLDVAGFPVAQDKYEVRTQVILSPLFKEEVEKVFRFEPTLDPLIFHW